mgnify:CR=1 FL=1
MQKMSFHEIYSKYADFDFDRVFGAVSSIDIDRAIDSGERSVKDLIARGRGIIGADSRKEPRFNTKIFWPYDTIVYADVSIELLRK